MDEALIVAVLILFFVGLAVRIFSIEEELERQAVENYGFVKDEMTLLHLQG